MYRFKFLKKNLVFVLASCFLLSGCGIGRVGGEKQTLIGKALSLVRGNRSTSRKGYCKAGTTKETQKINDAVAIKEGSAPFLVSEVIGSVGVDYKDNLPNEFRLNLKARIKDFLKEDTAIPSTSFTIKYRTTNEKGEIVLKEISRPTDDSGYLIWTEVYPFKYVVQPFWIRLHREVVKEDGPYAGEVTLPTAVNFWLEEDANIFKSVMDLRRRYYQNDDIFKKHPITELGLQCLADKKDPSLLQIWAPNVDVQFSQSLSTDKTGQFNSTRALIDEHYKKPCTDDVNDKECSGRDLNMELTIPLELRMRRLNGALRTMRVNGGHYNITAQLVGEYPEGSERYYRIHGETLSIETVSMSFREGQGTQYLNPKFHLKIPYFNTNANHKLILEIQETNGLPFRKFQGVYTLKKPDMGSVKTFIRDSFLEKTYSLIPDESSDDFITIIEDMNIEYIYTYAKNEAQKLKKKYPNTDEKTLIQRVLKRLNFKPAHMSVSIETVRFANTKNNEDCKTNETIGKRRVEYVATACLDDIFAEIKDTDFKIFRKDLTSNEGLVELFRVEEEDGYKEPLGTNQASCIAWRDTIDHNNFNRQIYFPRRMYFISEEQDLYGEALIAVSPWHNQFQFFQDITQLHVSGIRTTPKGVDHPRFIIPQFRSVNFYPSSVIDNFLHLHIKYNTRFLFQPIITRPDSLAWGKLPRSRELVRDGYYLTRVLIARSPQETGSLYRTQTKKESDKKKAKVLNNNHKLDFHDLKYIHHTDTVVKVEANFVNMSVPIEFNTQQLLYIGSRNVVILQMAPANPDKYVYKPIKGDGSCHLDTEKTEWEPYLDHDLITFPFVGPVNTQNWVNWNVLQEACERDESGTIVNCLETDRIIDQSEEGRKFRHFDMDLVMNASIEKDGGKVAGPATAAQRAGFSAQGGPGGDFTGVSSKPVAKDTNKEPPSIITGVGGSDSCKNRYDDLQEAELQRQSEDAGQQRTTDPGGIIIITLRTETASDRGAILGTEECKKDPSCNAMQRELEQSSLFGRELETVNVAPFGPEEEVVGTILAGGLGTEECIEEEDIDQEEQKDVEFVSAGSDSEAGNTINVILEDFARVNSLKVVDLSHKGTQEKFLQEINSESRWVNEIAKQMEIKKTDGVVFHTISYLVDLFEGIYGPDKNREEFLSLWSQFDKKCNTDYVDYLTSLSTDNQLQAKPWEKFYQECAISLFRDHLNDKITAFEEDQITATDSEEFQKQYEQMVETRKIIESFYNPLPSFSSPEERSKKLTRLNVWDREIEPLFLEGIISEGIEKQDTVLTNSFAHSLCGFWFHSFLKDYLQPKQMQSAFNDYIRKLDYKLILESDLPSREANRRDEILGELFAMTPKEGELEQCSNSYRTCVLQDYCSASSHDSSRVNGNYFCKHISHLIKQDSSCMDFAFRKCQEPGNRESHLCRQTVNGVFTSEGQCKQSLKIYCEANPGGSICAEYNDMKCLSNYMSCSNKGVNTFVQAKEDFIDHFESAKEEWVDSESPLQTCLNNPYEFFHFENKMIVGNINRVKYRSGLMQHFSINGSFSIGSYMNWGSERTTKLGMKIGGKGGTMAFLSQERMNFWKRLTSLLSFDADVSMGTSTGESNAVRRSIDTRVANSLFLVASEANFEMDVTHFKRCLVVKPRPNAFTAEYGEMGLPQSYDESEVWPESFHGRDFKKIALARPGLMLCNPMRTAAEDKTETIQENYYYISQSNVRTETAHVLNLYDIANRPFVIVLRGRKEFLKYSHLLRQVTEVKNTDTEEVSSNTEAPVNMFIHYPHPVENMVGFSLAMRAFKDTGFYPGVYTYPSHSDSILNAQFVDRKTDTADNLLKFFHDHLNVFDVPPIPSHSMSHKPVHEAP